MKRKCLLLVALIILPLVSPLIRIPDTKASNGEANVCILELSNIGVQRI